MNLHSLKPATGSIKKRKRIARGPGSGHGGTSTRGHKGDKARTGHKLKRNFEGGQMPMQMRLPKRGFNNPNRVEYVPVSLERLQAIADRHGVTMLDINTLVEFGVVGKRERLKVLGPGELSIALNVSAHAISETAKAAIESKGGSFNLVN
ncbi:MAG: 50S ribosomal protein L15 [Saprospiraceae bacterium]|nr:50S ribosomal protein L15 [Saprospiraceae bacterium]